MNEEIKAVVDAWTVAGRVPSYHEEKKTQLYREWRSLANAVQKLVDRYITDQDKGAIPLLYGLKVKESSLIPEGEFWISKKQ